MAGVPDFDWRPWIGSGMRKQIDGVRITLTPDPDDDESQVVTAQEDVYTVRAGAPVSLGTDGIERAVVAAVKALRVVEGG